jgi:hypothetical protein
VLNIVLDTVRERGQIAIAVASSGVAALLLHGGRTAHSRFQIPIDDMNATSTCTIKAQSGLARLITRTSLIIWDEASMLSKHQISCVDRTICDLMPPSSAKSKQPFGGIIVVFSGGSAGRLSGNMHFAWAGDFRQVLPVVRHGERAKIVAQTMKRWDEWHNVRILHLTENMRIQRMHELITEQADNFAQYLLRIGDGREQTVVKGLFDDFVRLPDSMCVKTKTINSLISAVFPTFNNIQSFAARAILAPKNVDVEHINDKIIELFPGEIQIYLSADSVWNVGAASIFPTEFLNSLNISDMPPHQLRLKLNCPIILLRNLNALGGLFINTPLKFLFYFHKHMFLAFSLCTPSPTAVYIWSLCNGTRMVCRGFQPHVIEAEIINGSHVGQRVFLPRMCLPASDSGLPFKLRRRQFPIRVAFGMTINKSQRLENISLLTL